MKKIFCGILFLLLNFLAISFAITLKVSHQFPGGRGDARDEAVKIIANLVYRAKVDLKLKLKS